jgi:hypothetical protein
MNFVYSAYSRIIEVPIHGTDISYNSSVFHVFDLNFAVLLREFRVPILGHAAAEAGRKRFLTAEGQISPYDLGLYDRQSDTAR